MLVRNGDLVRQCGWTGRGYVSPQIVSKPVDHDTQPVGREWFQNVTLGDHNNVNFFCVRYIRFALNATGIVIGSGDTEPSYEDYKLENMITTGLTASAPQITYYTGNKIGGRYAYVLNNITNSDITVAEFGYQNFGYCQCRDAGSSYISTAQAAFLYSRSLLENPIIVPANSSALLELDFYSIFQEPNQ